MPRIALVVVLIAGWLSGCATPHGDTPPSDTPTLERILAELALEAPAPEDSPAELDAALMPDIPPRFTPADPEPERFDLAVEDLPASTFFRSLVRGTPYNLVVHPDVRGTLSLELKDVTVPEVLAVVRDAYGYEFELRDGTYVVLPARLQSRIFHVDYLNVDRRGESSTRVSSGEATGTTDDSQADTRTAGTRGSGRQRTPRPSSRIDTESRADFWGQLEGSVRSIVGRGEGREVTVDAHAGLVVVRAMPDELRDVGNYLTAAQGNLQRQVILEAKILEVRLSEAHQTGINWAALGSGSRGDIAALQTGLVDGSSPFLTEDGMFDRSSLTGTAAQQRFSFGSLFAIGARTDDFAAIIRLLNTQGDVQVLSSPRVATLNNQKAVIKVGNDEFFVTDIRSDRSIGGVGAVATRGQDIELTPFFSGISLDVTPQIDREGTVTLHVHPAVSEVVDQTKTLTIAGETQSLPLAFSTVRESDSVVRARTGQVVVIGGLMQDQSTRRRGQPGPLGDIPLLGHLFRQTSRVNERTELVILLRPVVADQQAWYDATRELSERLRGGE